LKSVLKQKFFLCDFAFSIPQKAPRRQNFILVKNNAQQEIPNNRHPSQQGKM